MHHKWKWWANTTGSQTGYLEAQIRAIMPEVHIFNQVRDTINPNICDYEDKYVHVQSLQNKNMLKMQQDRLLSFYTGL
jgi:hypothetical protein